MLVSMHKHVLLRRIVIEHLVLEFAPIALISLLFGIFVALSEVFVPSCLPKHFKSV